MGNDISGNRWVFDGPTTAAQEELLLGLHTIIAFFWVEDGARDIATDDDLIMQDGARKIIYQSTAAGTPLTASSEKSVVIGYPGLQVDGFQVEALDGGILIVWLAIPYT